MARNKWLALFGAAILLTISALVVSVRRARPSLLETRSVSLDYAANFWGLFERFVGLPFRILMIRLAGIKEGDNVLDIGCATGTLTMLEKEKTGPTGYVGGIDIGPHLIARARQRAAKRGLNIDFRLASIDDLPFPDNTFDEATSSLMVHHLPTEVKLAGFGEVYRVLKPGGRYLIFDFPVARGLTGRITLAITHLFARFSDEAKFTLDIMEGKLPEMLKEAGFEDVEELGTYRLAGIQPMAFTRARKSW